MKGMFIPEITVEMFRNACLESIETLMAEGEVYDIEYDPKSAEQDVPDISFGKWVSCSERLPVICEYDANGQKTFSCRVLSTQVYGNGLVFVGSDRYVSDRGWLSEVLDENGVPESKVIAWMPLPEPWKGEKE